MNGPERAEPLIAARMATRRRKSRLKFTCVRAHWNRERKKLVDRHLARRSPRHSLARTLRTGRWQVAESPCRETLNALLLKEAANLSLRSEMPICTQYEVTRIKALAGGHDGAHPSLRTLSQSYRLLLY